MLHSRSCRMLSNYCRINVAHSILEEQATLDGAGSLYAEYELMSRQAKKGDLKGDWLTHSQTAEAAVCSMRLTANAV